MMMMMMMKMKMKIIIIIYLYYFRSKYSVDCGISVHNTLMFETLACPAVFFRSRARLFGPGWPWMTLFSATVW